MAEELKVTAVKAEEPKTMAEKEETVAENAGIPIDKDGVYKLDLDKFNQENKKEDAVQEQSTCSPTLETYRTGKYWQPGAAATKDAAGYGSQSTTALALRAL